MTVLTFGELLLRLSAPGYERLFQTGDLKATFCGGEANVAVSLANFGIDSRFVTKVPDSDVGKAAIRSLNCFGVDTSHIVYGDGRMGLYYLEKGASQRPSKIIYDRAYSSIALSEPSDYDWNLLFEGVDWFHWTGITPALSTSLKSILLEACKVAKAKGITVSCDLNYRKKLWSPTEAQATMRKLMNYVDICIGNEEDASLSLGLRVISNVDAADLRVDDYCSTAKRIVDEFNCKYVAFTLRESWTASRNGWSAILYNSGAIYCSKKYDIQIIDRVGGGDSFAAGLIYGLIQNMNPQDAIEFATAASCLKQTIEGDYNRTSIDEINALLKSGGNGRVER